MPESFLKDSPSLWGQQAPQLALVLTLWSAAAMAGCCDGPVSGGAEELCPGAWDASFSWTGFEDSR